MTLKQYQSLLLPREEWHKYANRELICFEIGKGNQWLFYFGSNHSHTPNDPMFKKLEKYWKNFLAATKSQNCIVLVEGSVRKNIEDNIDEAIQHGGEGSFITILANKGGIPVSCPEPSFKEIDKEVSKYFTYDEIEFYEFVNIVDQWNRFPKRPHFEEYIDSFMRKDKQRFGWKNYDFSLKHMVEIHSKLFRKRFNKFDQNFFNNLANPNHTDTVINKVARTTSNIRDARIVANIKKLWTKGKNIFVVFGSGHAIIEKPALLKLLK